MDKGGGRGKCKMRAKDWEARRLGHLERLGCKEGELGGREGRLRGKTTNC